MLGCALNLPLLFIVMAIRTSHLIIYENYNVSEIDSILFFKQTRCEKKFALLSP